MKYLIALTLIITSQAHAGITGVDYTNADRWVVCHVNLTKETKDSMKYYSKYLPGKIVYEAKSFSNDITYTVNFTKAYNLLKINQIVNPPVISYLGKEECKLLPIKNKNVDK